MDVAEAEEMGRQYGAAMAAGISAARVLASAGAPVATTEAQYHDRLEWIVQKMRELGASSAVEAAFKRAAEVELGGSLDLYSPIDAAPSAGESLH